MSNWAVVNKKTAWQESTINNNGQCRYITNVNVKDRKNKNYKPDKASFFL